jgi:hypothetical protein
MSLYRVGIRGKKWRWTLFTGMLDIATHNAWALMKQAGGAMRQLEFRREICQTYLTRYKSSSKVGGRHETSRGTNDDSCISDDIRYDGKDHLVFPTEEN